MLNKTQSRSVKTSRFSWSDAWDGFSILKFLGVLSPILFVLVGILLPQVGALPEEYYDIVVDTLAKQNTNRSWELLLFYGLLFGSIVLLLLWIRCYPTSKRENPPQFSGGRWVFIGLVLLNVLYALFLGKPNWVFLFFLCIYVVIRQIKLEWLPSLFLLTIFGYYAMMGLLSLVYYYDPARSLSEGALIFATAILVLCLCGGAMIFGERLLRWGIFAVQLMIPLNFLMILNPRYLYQDEYISLPYPINYQIAVLLMAMGLFLWILWEGIKALSLGDKAGWKDLLSGGAIVGIYALRSFINNIYSLVIIDDPHHVAESVLIYNQIRDFGQSLYTEIIPASGLFPLVVGWWNDIFNEGSYISAFSTHTLVITFFAILTMALFISVFGKTPAIFLALVFRLTTYNRIYMVMPVALLLLNPKLIKKSEYWLPCWVLSILAAGLYYPVLGVGLLVASLPFGWGQLKDFWKKRASLGKNLYWVTWVLTAAVVISALPLLFLMAKHTISYGQQSILADGISVFGQTLPSYYMPYLEEPSLRILAQYGLKYVLPIFYVLISAFLLFGQVCKKRGTSWEALCLSFALWVPMVSFSFTLVREDSGMAVSRASHPMVAGSALIIGLLVKKWIENPKKISLSPALALLLLCGVFFVPSSSAMPEPYVKVPENYSQYQAEDLAFAPGLGTGFAPTAYADYCDYWGWEYDKLGAEYPLLSDVGQGIFLVDQLPVAATGATMIAKDYTTQNTLLQICESEEIVFHTVDSITNYYIYYDFLVEQGYRIGENNMYLSPQLMVELYGASYQAPDPSYASFCDSDLGNIPVSWGRSWETLEPIFTKVSEVDLEATFGYDMEILANSLQITGDGPQVSFSFDQGILGQDGDFLLIKLSSEVLEPAQITGLTDYLSPDKTGENYQISLRWDDENSSAFFQSNLGEGVLLIPLGASPSWLFGWQEDIVLEFSGEFQLGDEIIIEEIALYKLDQNR